MADGGRPGAIGGAQAIDRAVALLQVLGGASDGDQRLKDLAAKAGLTQPTAARILKALGAHGFVEHDPASRRYRLGLGLLTLAATAAGRSSAKGLARPWLLRLAQDCTANAFLMLRAGTEAVCVDRIDGGVIVHSITGAIGGRVPLGVGPGSLAVLAFLDEREAEAIIALNAARYRTFPGIDADRVARALPAIRATGYAFDPGRVIEGVRGLAVPLRSASAGAVGALSIGALAATLPDERVPGLAQRLAEAARDIEDGLNPLDPALARPDAYHMEGIP